MDIQQYMQRLGEQARAASRAMARASSGDKDKALAAIASALRSHRNAVLHANQQDLDNGRNNGLDAALLDRLGLGQLIAKLDDGCLPSHHFLGRVLGRGLCLRGRQDNDAQKQCDAGCLDWFDHDCLSQSVKLFGVRG